VEVAGPEGVAADFPVSCYSDEPITGDSREAARALGFSRPRLEGQAARQWVGPLTAFGAATLQKGPFFVPIGAVVTPGIPNPGRYYWAAAFAANLLFPGMELTSWAKYETAPFFCARSRVRASASGIARCASRFVTP
jgi:hypothetical protein